MSELILLGSGTGIPSLKRGSPGLALVTQTSKLLIDSGSGSLIRMLSAGITYLDVDLLLYTHTHPDHTADLVPILFACKSIEDPRQKDLSILGGPGFQHFFDQLGKLYGSWIQPQSYRLTVETMRDKPFLFRDLEISSRPMAHLADSIGYRIELSNGKSVAVSGDTDYCETIVDLAFGVDLLVLECSFPEGRKVEGHLTPSLAGRVAAESRCKRLLLIHLYPVCDQCDILKQCRETFDGETIVGEDLMRIIL
jgi:ribonuclease BN (tRNA processing enzyme)